MPSEHEIRPPYPEGVVRIIEGPRIKACCVLKNGNIVSASSDANLRVWDVNTGELLKVLEGHTMYVGFVCTVDTPEGERVVSGSLDTTVRVWDVVTGQCLKVLGGDMGFIMAVCALGNSHVISSHADQHLRVWNVVTGERLKIIKNRTHIICTLGEPGSQRLVTAWGQWLSVWDADNWVHLKNVGGHTQEVNSICTLDTPEGKRLVSASDDETLRVWDVATWTCLKVLKGHAGGGWVLSVHALGDGRVVSASRDNTLRVWDINKENPKILKILRNKYSGVLATLSPTRFVSRGDKSGFLIWDISNLKDFPAPDRSGFFHRVQNTLRGKSSATVAPEASTVSATVAPEASTVSAPAALTVTTVTPIGPLGSSNTLQAWKGGRIQGKRKSQRNKRKRNSRNHRKSRKSRY